MCVRWFFFLSSLFVFFFLFFFLTWFVLLLCPSEHHRITFICNTLAPLFLVFFLSSASKLCFFVQLSFHDHLQFDVREFEFFFLYFTQNDCFFPSSVHWTMLCCFICRLEFACYPMCKCFPHFFVVWVFISIFFFFVLFLLWYSVLFVVVIAIFIFPCVCVRARKVMDGGNEKEELFNVEYKAV